MSADEKDAVLRKAKEVTLSRFRAESTTLSDMGMSLFLDFMDEESRRHARMWMNEPANRLALYLGRASITHRLTP